MTKPTDLETSDEVPRSIVEERRERLIRGTAWTLATYVGGNLLRLLSNLILARLLFPEAFALLALAGILIQGLKMFSDLGIGASIIQSSRGDEVAFLNTAWTVQVIRGVGLFVVACLLAYPFALFYEISALLWIIPISAFSSIISGFNSTALFTMNRHLNLGRIAILDLCESVVKLVVTIAWALVHPSVLALLGGVIASRMFYTLASHTLLAGPTRHRITWNREAARELIAFGGWVFLSTAVTFLAQQADRLMLGKLVPLAVLGVYSLALMFSRLPIDICNAVTGRVVFPTLASAVRDEPHAMARLHREGRRLLLTVGAAATIGFMVISPWFFSLAYDERYREAAWLAPLIAGALWFNILQSSSDRALLALGDTRSLFLSNMTNFAATLVACLAGFHLWGMAGFIFGFGIGGLAGHLVIVAALARRHLPQIRQDINYTAIVICGAVLGAWLPSRLSMDIASAEGLWRFAIQAAVGLGAGLIAGHAAISAIQGKARRANVG